MYSSAQLKQMTTLTICQKYLFSIKNLTKQAIY